MKGKVCLTLCCASGSLCSLCMLNRLIGTNRLPNALSFSPITRSIQTKNSNSRKYLFHDVVTAKKDVCQSITSFQKKCNIEAYIPF